MRSSRGATLANEVVRCCCFLVMFVRFRRKFHAPFGLGKNRMTEVADYRFHTHGMDEEPLVKGARRSRPIKAPTSLLRINATLTFALIATREISKVAIRRP